MADPLAELTDREVPERTNFFNPADAQDIISRYGNARRSAAVSDLAARSAERMASAREREFRAQRDADLLDRQKVMWDRDDEDYHTKKDALRQRGDFIRQMGQMLRPDAEDYNRQVTEFMAGLPEDLQEDDTIKAVLTSMNAEADDFRARRNAQAAKDQTFKNQTSLLNAREGFKIKHISPEEFGKYRLEDGSLDVMSLRAEDNALDRIYKEKEFDRRLDLVNKGRIKLIDRADLSRKGRDNRGKVEKFIVEDRVAFPRHMDALVEAYKQSTGKTSVDLNLLKDSPKWRDAYRRAVAWDKDPVASELSASFAYDDPDTYVNLTKGLTDSQKERRRSIWEHAHNDQAVEEIQDGDSTTPSPSTEPGEPLSETPEKQAPAPEPLTINGKKYARINGKIVELQD